MKKICDDKFWIVSIPTYSMISFVLLNIIAMFLYPGGNINNDNQIGYSLIYNFYSDLGMTVSYSDDNNIISCLLFNCSLCIVGICFAILFYKTRKLFSNYKLLSLIGTIFGIGAAFSYIGVALTPANLYHDLYNNPWLHVIFAHWIFRFLFASSIIHSILIFKTKNFDNKYAYGFIVFGLMVFAYVLVSEVYLNDPRIFPEHLVAHVIAQKMIVFWMLFSIYIYSKGLGKYLFNKL